MPLQAELAHASFIEAKRVTNLVAHGLDDLRTQHRLVFAEVAGECVSVDDDLVGRVVGLAPGKPLGDATEVLRTGHEHSISMMCGTVIGDGDRDATQLVLNLGGQRVERSAHGGLKVSLGMDRYFSWKVWAGVRFEGSLLVVREPVDAVLECLEGLLVHVFDVFV